MTFTNVLVKHLMRMTTAQQTPKPTERNDAKLQNAAMVTVIIQPKTIENIKKSNLISQTASTTLPACSFSKHRRWQASYLAAHE